MPNFGTQFNLNDIPWFRKFHELTLSDPRRLVKIVPDPSNLMFEAGKNKRHRRYHKIYLRALKGPILGQNDDSRFNHGIERTFINIGIKIG